MTQINTTPSATESLTITAPDDFHLHLRHGELLQTVVNHSASQFRRAVVMPNLTPPITTLAMALEYQKHIEDATATAYTFEPLMTLYLTPTLTASEVEKAYVSGVVQAVKLYPAGATTNSDAGVSNFEAIIPVLEKMAELGMPLLIHGETTDQEVDIFDRERVFIDETLDPIRKKVPTLKIVMEHITTLNAVQYVLGADKNLAATITPHHLLLNRNAIFKGGINPHHYCLPILKREEHRQALVAAAISGDPRFFAGTDSAPHSQDAKESSCGCAGIYTGYNALSLYAEAFDAAGALDKLEGFCSFYGADFYNIKRNSGTITLYKKENTVPDSFSFGNERVIPMRAGETLSWTVEK